MTLTFVKHCQPPNMCVCVCVFWNITVHQNVNFHFLRWWQRLIIMIFCFFVYRHLNFSTNPWRRNCKSALCRASWVLLTLSATCPLHARGSDPLTRSTWSSMMHSKTPFCLAKSTWASTMHQVHVSLNDAHNDLSTWPIDMGLNDARNDLSTWPSQHEPQRCTQWPLHLAKSMWASTMHAMTSLHDQVNVSLNDAHNDLPTWPSKCEPQRCTQWPLHMTNRHRTQSCTFPLGQSTWASTMHTMTSLHDQVNMSLNDARNDLSTWPINIASTMHTMTSPLVQVNMSLNDTHNDLSTWPSQCEPQRCTQCPLYMTKSMWASTMHTMSSLHGQVNMSLNDAHSDRVRDASDCLKGYYFKCVCVYVSWSGSWGKHWG